MITPVYLVWGIFFLITLSSILGAYLNDEIRFIFKDNYKYLFLLLVISIISSFPFNYNFFYGLEYEDAFIFTEYSRYLLYNSTFSVDPFQTKGCMLGSLTNCISEGTYGGHLLVLSSIGYLSNLTFGYTPQVICLINFIASLLSVCLVYLVSYTITNDKRISVLSSLIFSLSPAITLFHTSGLAETLSATSIIFTLFLYLLLIEQQHKFSNLSKALISLLLFLGFSFCLLQKRENLILAFIPMITIIKACFERKLNKDIVLKVTLLAFTIILIVLTYHYGINVFNIEKEEGQEITKATFSASYFLSLAPIFIKSLFNYKWFFLFSYFVLIGLVILPLKLKENPLYVYPLLLLAAYFLAYTLHYRSYYFIKYGLVHEFESLRYITNFYPFYSLIGGFAVIYIYDAIKTKMKVPIHLLWGGSLILLIYLVYANVSLKNEFYQIEQENRIIPVKEVISGINQSESVVITDVPLIFQVLGSESLQVIDLQSIGRKGSINLIIDIMRSDKNIYFLNNIVEDKKYKYERWPEAMKFMDSLFLVKVQEYNSPNYALYKAKTIP